MTVQTNNCALYKIRNQNNEVCGYLFPTIHLTSDQILPLPEKVYKALNKSSTLFIECLPKTAQQISQFVDRKLMVPKEITMETCIQHITATVALIQDLHIIDRRANREGLKKLLFSNYLNCNDPYEAQVHACHSFLTHLKLYLLGIDPSLSIEEHLMQKAKTSHKLILDLEKPEEIAEVLDWSSKQANKPKAPPSFEVFKKNMQELKSNVDDWKDGKPSFIKNLDEELAASTDKRTATMVDRIDAVLREDQIAYRPTCLSMISDCFKAVFSANKDEHENVARERYFFAIGTGHCWGQDGARRLLEAKGWKLERMR